MPGLTAAVAAPSVAAKAWRTLQAELLLGGYRADLLDAHGTAPSLIVTRWAMTRSFDDLDEARAWADQVLSRQDRLEEPQQPAQDVRHSPREAAHATGSPAAG